MLVLMFVSAASADCCTWYRPHDPSTPPGPTADTGEGDTSAPSPDGVTADGSDAGATCGCAHDPGRDTSWAAPVLGLVRRARR